MSDSITEKLTEMVASPHLKHAGALGLGSVLITKYLEKGKPQEGTNKQLMVGLGVFGVSFYWMYNNPDHWMPFQ